jgi:hypothetical protein
MKQKVGASKGQKASRSLDSNLLKRVIELQKLRKQIRLAEAAVRTPPVASQAVRA